MWLKRSRALKDNGGLPEPGLREIAFSGFSHQDKALCCTQQSLMPLLETFIHFGEPVPQQPADRLSSLYMAFPYVEHDLVSYVEAHPPQTADVRSIFDQLLAALNHLHCRGVVHRNLKCQTILVKPDGRLLLGGLCTAQMVCPSYCYDVPKSWECSTISARAPELLLQSRAYGPAQDIWAAGMVIATICKCDGFGTLGFFGDPALEPLTIWEPEGQSFLSAIFRRFGRPATGHPLRDLPGWTSSFEELTQSFPLKVGQSPWSDAGPILGTHGVSLLACLTDLDSRCRPSAEEARQSVYFQGHDCTDGKMLAEVDHESSSLKQSISSEELENVLDPALDVRRVCGGAGYFPDSNVVSSAACDICPPCEGDEDFCKSKGVSQSIGDERQCVMQKTDVSVMPELQEACQAEEVCLRHADPWSSVRSCAAEYHITKEAAEKHEQRSVIRSAIHAVTISFRRCGRNPPHLVRYVCSFIWRAHCPFVDCLAFTIDITARMRAILLDWITEVTAKYKLHEPVLHYTAKLIDAYLLRHPQIVRKRLQLLGATAIMVAEKVSGDEAVEIPDLVYICDNQYVQDDVIAMEEDLLAVLREVWPRWSGYHYLSYYAEEMQLPKTWFHVAQMFLERSLLNYSLTRHATSLPPAGACLLAIRAAKNHPDLPWQPAIPDACSKLAILCKQSIGEVRSVAAEMTSSFSSASLGVVTTTKLIGACGKFKNDRYSQVSIMSDVLWSDN